VEVKSFNSMSGERLAASAARPEVTTAELRKKLRRFIPFPAGFFEQLQLESEPHISVFDFR
jgi:hypothetical protein